MNPEKRVQSSLTAGGQTAPVEGRRVRVWGTVQGVGFRPWVYRIASGLGLTGRVWNDSSGVTIEVFGDAARLERFLANLRHDAPQAASVVDLAIDRIPAEPSSSFAIVDSGTAVERRVSIPPDLATCDACVADVLDTKNPRFRYPFTNCTNCGPRFTIAVDIPYDREATTMAPFAMCDRCRREFGDVDDRRFHAQPIACASCGPRLTLHANDGSVMDGEDPVAAAASALAAGQVVAVKGLGGFHLACDATSAEAVARLRQRKHRDEKPLAVMVADLAAAEAVAEVDGEGRRLLTSVERPIVLLRARPGSAIAANVAPRNRFLGVLLPYTPLHHLLLAAAGRPLVMTSGNVSEEPIAFRNDEALARLGSIADLLLLHDREIWTRCDDSVVGVVAGAGVVFRRSRGFVPRAIAVGRPFARPVLACGALLKNTFCLAAGDSAWLGPHIGDLENLDAYDSYREGLVRLEHFLQVRPEIVAHDLHPDYLSTRYARMRPEAVKVPVQHHHAHVVSVMAEHQIDGRVIGIAYDGTGYGTDGTMWGGEVLVADARSFTRVATFRPIPLAGGDRAIRHPWRIALALLTDAFGDQWPAGVAEQWPGVEVREMTLAHDLLRQGLNCPLARGVGRYFDGVGALVLGRGRASFEGQIAMEWNQVADPHGTASYPFRIDHSLPVPEIDLRPTVRAIVAAMQTGAGAPSISAAFHNTLVAATAEVVGHAATAHGRLPVVASGGCLQNARLAEGLRAALAPEHEVWLHRRVPPGDGGIALGQAVIANAIAGGAV